jgi:hypothetical protein
MAARGELQAAEAGDLAVGDQADRADPDVVVVPFFLIEEQAA